MDKDIFVQVSDEKVKCFEVVAHSPLSRPTILKPPPPSTRPSPKPQPIPNPQGFFFNRAHFSCFLCIRILRPNPLSPATNHSNLQPYPQPHKIRLRHPAQILSTPLRKISALPLGMFWYLQSHPRPRLLLRWRSPPSFSPQLHQGRPQDPGSSLAGLRYSMSGMRKSCKRRP